MPRKNLMSYEPQAKRWVKMFKGVRYRITCDDLGLRPSQQTKEFSAPLANDWWQQKESELSGQTLNARIVEQWAIDEGISKAEALAEIKGIGQVLQTLQELKGVKATPTNKTLAYHLDLWLKDNVINGVGQKSIRERKQWGSTLPACNVDDINEQYTTIYFQSVASNKLSVARKRKFIIFYRMLVNWLFMEGAIATPPRNLKKKFTLVEPHREIKTFNNVKEVIDNLPPHKKAWALLALNCGLNNVDLGLIQNKKTTGAICYLEGGFLIRKRHKLIKHGKAPMVKYKLWKETIEALDAVKSDGLLVFPDMYIAGEKYDNDKFYKQWSIGGKPAMSLKDFRTHGATIIETHATLARYKTRYLANVPTGITDTYYAGASDELFFEVLEYLKVKTIG